MECPYCGKTESKVIDSRLAKEAITIRRRRQSLACSQRFTTYESTEERLLPFLITKNTGQGATIPNLRTILSTISSTLTMPVPCPGSKAIFTPYYPLISGSCYSTRQAFQLIPGNPLCEGPAGNA